MSINWIVRIKNPVFWIQVIGAFLLPILGYFGLNWSDLTTWSSVGQLLLDAISNPFVLVTAIFAVFNAVNDPTTKGLSDSTNALSYNEPK